MASATVDPFTVEIVRNALDAICEQMATTIERTAYSTLIRDILDFSTALFDARGRIIAQGSRIPAHLNTMGPALETVLARYLPAAEWQPGDVVVLNDPYHGAQHLPDVFTLLPIFHEGKLLGFAGCMGHQIDVGGRAAGSFGGDATDIFNEGLRLPPVKLYEAGRIGPSSTSSARTSASPTRPWVISPRKWPHSTSASASCAASSRAMAPGSSRRRWTS